MHPDQLDGLGPGGGEEEGGLEAVTGGLLGGVVAHEGDGGNRLEVIEVLHAKDENSVD